MKLKNGGLCVLAAVVAMPALADFSYEQTSRVTGGSMMRMMGMVPGGKKALEPQKSYVYLKGNKLANVDARRVSIIDLDSETMTEIDLEKKQYSTITFQEMAQAMEAARKKAEQELKKQKADADLTFNVQVKETGQRRQIQGFDTKEMQMLLEMGARDRQSGQAGAMEFDISMWMAPEVAGYGEIKRFYMRMAERIAWAPGMASLAGLMQTQPGMSEGMAKMAKEVQKLDGVPILQVTSILGGGPAEGMPDMPAMPNVGEAVSDEAKRTAANEAGYQTSRATRGRFGGLAGAAAGGMLGGIGRKKQEAPKADPPAAAAPAPEGKKGVFMEMTMESSNFSTRAVDSAKFAIPAGFKQVDHEMKKLLRQAK